MSHDRFDAGPQLGARGQSVGPWKLRQRLGVGAFGETWLARHADGRVAACKLLERAPGTELEALAQVVHPSIPLLMDGGSRPVPFIAMEAVPGKPLGHILDNGARPEAFVAQMAVNLADALAAVHRAGLWHGDVGADNVLCQDGEVPRFWLIDFGLAGADGGTPVWAAPEVLAGEGGSFAGDIYSLGLLLRALLLGCRPGTLGDRSSSLSQRSSGVPEPIDGLSDWMTELLARMLDPRAASRPDAHDIVDVLTLHGFAPPAVTAARVRDRARVVEIPLPDLQEAIGTWRGEGGALALVGPPHSGRTPVLRRLAWSLTAEGRAAALVLPSDQPWGSIEGALRALGSELPVSPDEISRIDAVVDQLVEEEVALMVAGLEACDAKSRATIAALIEAGGRVVMSCGKAPSGIVRSVTLSPMTRESLADLLRTLVGAGATNERLLDPILEASGGLPGRVVDVVCRAMDAGAMEREHRQWVWRADRAPAFDTASMDAALVADLSPVVKRVGGLLALQPRGIAPEALVAVARLNEAELDAAVHALAERQLATVLCDRVQVLPAARDTLLAQLDDPATWRRDLVEAQVRAGWDDTIALVQHALALPDRGLLSRYGAAAVEQLGRIDSEAAARLAERCWSNLQTSELALARIEVMRASGRVTEALDFGREALPLLVGSRRLAMCVSLATIEADDRQSERGATRWLDEARRALGDRAEPASMVLCRATVAQMQERHAESANLLRGLVEQPVPTGTAEVRVWLRARVLLAQALHQMGQLSEGLQMLESTPPDVGVGTSARARLQSGLGRLLWLDGRYAAADEQLGRAAQRRSGLSAADRARLLNNLGAARYHLGRRQDAVAAWEEAQALFSRLGAQRESARCLVNLCAGYTDLGQWERARRSGQRALAQTRTLNSPEVRVHALLNTGRLGMVHGDQAGSRKHFLEVAELARASGLDREAAEASVRLAEHALRFRTPDANQRIAEAVRAAENSHAALDLAEARMLEVVSRAGPDWSLTDLKAAIGGILTPVREQGATAALAELRTWAAVAMLHAGYHAEAQEYLDRARAYAEESGSVLLQNRVDEAAEQLARMETQDGDGDGLMRLVDLSVAINEIDDLGQLLEHIANAGRDLLVGDRAFLLSEEGEILASCPGDVDARPSMSVVRQVASTGREVIAADLGERGDLREQRSVALMDLRSVYCAPLIHRGDLLGMLYVDSRDVRRKDVWQGARLIRGLAALGAVAIRRTKQELERIEQVAEAARLAERAAAADRLSKANDVLEQVNEELRLSAITDPLTKLYNRRHLTDMLEDCTATLSRRGRPYGLLLFDIDHFKHINDTWGHPAGDAVLRVVADKLVECAREEDLVFRFGGEEMVILMETDSLHKVQAMAERVLACLREAPIVTEDGDSIPVTASCGVALAGPEREGWESVLRRTDAALYRAKEGGRDRVIRSEGKEERQDAAAR